MREGWHLSMIRKLKFCEELCLGNDAFIHADCDVQFFRTIKQDAEKALESFDIAFQHDGQNHLCAGLFCAKPSVKLSNFFKTAQEVIKNHGIESQHAINLLLRSKDMSNMFADIKYGYLPNTWWSHGCETFKVWDGEDVNPPENIVAHHANWVEGVEKKIKLLDMVKEKVYNGKYTWVEKNATTCGLESIYGQSKDTFLLMPTGKDGNEILKSSKLTKDIIEECTKRGAM